MSAADLALARHLQLAEYKCIPCKFFHSASGCRLGDACAYGHGDATARQSSAVAAQPRRPSRSERSHRPAEGTRLADDAIDVDRMSYEELLALEERIGVVPCGVKPHILARLPLTTVRVENACASSAIGDSCCAICASDYGVGDTLRVLPCNHAFHKGCIDEWFAAKATCPICKADVNEAARSVAACTSSMMDRMRIRDL